MFSAYTLNKNVLNISKLFKYHESLFQFLFIMIAYSPKLYQGGELKSSIEIFCHKMNENNYYSSSYTMRGMKLLHSFTPTAIFFNEISEISKSINYSIKWILFASIGIAESKILRTYRFGHTCIFRIRAIIFFMKYYFNMTFLLFHFNIDLFLVPTMMNVHFLH